ncbi:hypothetical protein ACVWXO_003588 [Bradyrhizobium sp. LM2.7]
MTEAVVDDIVAVLPPLLNALEALGFFQRNLHPPVFASVMNAIGAPEEALQAAGAAIGEWPEQFAGLSYPAGSRLRRDTRRLRRAARCRARQRRPGRGLPRAAPRPARAGGALSARGAVSAGKQLLPQRCQPRGREPAGPARIRRGRAHRHLP